MTPTSFNFNGNSSLKIYPISERSLCIEFGRLISTAIAEEIRILDHILQADPFLGLVATIPAYTTLTLFFDPVKVSNSGLRGNSCFEKIVGFLQNLPTAKENADFQSDPVIIPVCYGNDFGPDLERVAALANLSVDAAIEMHSGAIYMVHMIGFVPGFAYLGGLDHRLSAPRRAQPRAVVPAGAVGIAGEQTGIYPIDIPGGWQIIGQTPLQLFSPLRDRPTLLKAGDRVQFKPISTEEFLALKVQP